MKTVTLFIVPLLAISCGASAAFAADDAPQEIVARSIKAHGGNVKLARQAYWLEVKGRFFAADKAVEHSGSIKADGPTRSRFEIRAPAWQVVLVVNGDQGWIRERGATRSMNGKELAEAKEDQHTDWVTTLVPLLGKDVTLSRLDPENVAGSAAVGVRVCQRGFRDVDLYFDKETWLLVKKRIRRSGEKGSEIEYETFYGGFRDFKGVKAWTTAATYRDGKRHIETEVVEAQFLDKLPADIFVKP